jgi:hypothetical protein
MDDRAHSIVADSIGTSEVVDTNDLTKRIVAARVLSALRDSGFAIVELPEPDDDHHDGIAFWWQSAEVGANGDMVITQLDPGSEAIWFNPDVARGVAAALLAAANAAEQPTTADR